MRHPTNIEARLFVLVFSVHHLNQTLSCWEAGLPKYFSLIQVVYGKRSYFSSPPLPFPYPAKTLVENAFFKIYKERVLCENSGVQVLSLNYSNSKTIRVGISFSIFWENQFFRNFSKFVKLICKGFFNQNFCFSFWPGSDFLTALSSRIQIFCF